MPKLTAEQAYEKFVELEKKGDVNALVDHMVDCYQSPEAL